MKNDTPIGQLDDETWGQLIQLILGVASGRLDAEQVHLVAKRLERGEDDWLMPAVPATDPRRNVPRKVL